MNLSRAIWNCSRDLWPGAEDAAERSRHGLAAFGPVAGVLFASSASSAVTAHLHLQPSLPT